MDCKYLFVTHAFHKKTKSFEFFLNAIEPHLGRFDRCYLAPDASEDERISLSNEILKHNYSRIIFWQNEGLAEYFRQYSNIITIVPMWDAAMQRPLNYWRRFRGFNFISFSQSLHTVLTSQKCRSFYFQYWPKPGLALDMENVDVFSRAYFWERRPKSNWNAARACQIAEWLKIKYVNIHAVSDFGDKPSALSTPLTVSRSSWYETNEEMEESLRTFGVYISPREYEGIGLSFLEAMARGQCVVGRNLPTLSEYIIHDVNGLLETDQHIPPFRRTFKELGLAAREACEVGHANWLNDINRLIEVIECRTGRYFYGTAIDADINLHMETRDVTLVPTLEYDKSKPPVLSIVITTRNAAEDLRLTLSHMLQQTSLSECEIVITDSYSRDETSKIAQEFHRLPIHYHLIRDSGIYDGMNKSIDLCHGTHIIFLNSGDYFSADNAVEKIIDQVKIGSASIYIGGHQYRDPKTRTVSFSPGSSRSQIRHLLDTGHFGELWGRSIPGHQATIYAREIFDIRRYNLRYEVAADHELFLWALTLGLQIDHLGFFISCYQGGGFSAQNSDLCVSEWHSIYHSYSRNPYFVDAAYSDTTGVRYGNNSLFAIGVGSEAYNMEGPYEKLYLENRFAWIPSKGVNLLFPKTQNGEFLSLYGFSRIENQVLKLTIGEKEIEISLGNLCDYGQIFFRIDISQSQFELESGRLSAALFESFPAPDNRNCAFGLFEPRTSFFYLREPNIVYKVEI